MHLLRVLLVLLGLAAQAHAAVSAQDKLSYKIKPCKGHYIYFETDNCANKDELKPRVVSADGLIRPEPTEAFPNSICVPEGAYHGHAYLETSIIKHDGSNAQNVTFWFQRYAPHEHTASLTVREDDDIGHAGNGLVLLTAADLEAGVFTSTPRSKWPLNQERSAAYILTGSGKDDALRLTYC